MVNRRCGKRRYCYRTVSSRDDCHSGEERERTGANMENVASELTKGAGTETNTR